MQLINLVTIFRAPTGAVKELRRALHTTQGNPTHLFVPMC
jgi:hypothetical protein